MIIQMAIKRLIFYGGWNTSGGQFNSRKDVRKIAFEVLYSIHDNVCISCRYLVTSILLVRQVICELRIICGLSIFSGSSLHDFPPVRGPSVRSFRSWQVAPFSRISRSQKVALSAVENNTS